MRVSSFLCFCLKIYWHHLSLILNPRLYPSYHSRCFYFVLIKFLFGLLKILNIQTPNSRKSDYVSNTILVRNPANVGLKVKNLTKFRLQEWNFSFSTNLLTRLFLALFSGKKAWVLLFASSHLRNSLRWQRLIRLGHCGPWADGPYGLIIND